ISPVRIPPSGGWQRISAGETFTVALRTDGSLWAWGENEHGELGVGNRIGSLVPIRVKFLETTSPEKSAAEFSR
ncbi:MAG: hypothetical protein WCL08_07885, partial [Verrucomicrobiota bacterium]